MAWSTQQPTPHDAEQLRVAAEGAGSFVLQSQNQNTERLDNETHTALGAGERSQAPSKCCLRS